MASPATVPTMLAATSDAIAGVGLAVVTAGIAFAALVAVGFVLLVRRSRRPSPRRSGDDLGIRADHALVRLDDDIVATADELGFAVAQFGQPQARQLESALRGARSTLAAAFAVKQQLDDARLAAGIRRAGAARGTGIAEREQHARILMLCETASEKLATERAVFDGMRGLERRASDDLRTVRESIGVTRDRLPDARAAVAALGAEYSAEAVAPVADNAAEAERLLDAAAGAADEAAADMDESGVSAVATTVHSADRDARQAAALLDRVQSHREALAAASARLVELIAYARSMIEEARRVRDTPPDPRTGAAVGDAIAYVERAVAAGSDRSGKTDPDAAIARVSAATDALDTALAGARTEEQRLTHAREALVGALFTARSQIATTHDYIRSRRGGAGAEARTRLAEGERLLAIAEVETDPVVALDTARSSATYSRDADALARYDLLH